VASGCKSQALVPTYPPATTHLAECTRDLLMLAARLGAVHDAVLTAVVALNTYEIELDQKSSTRLRSSARKVICDHFDGLRLNLHAIENCISGRR
jgi:hypothetical protein